MADLKYEEKIKYDVSMHIFSKFFLADVVFTFLPIGVVAVIRRSLGQLDDTFFAMPDWSFASIIIYGLAMTRALELKVKYQNDRSERVYALSRMCILGLIAAVVSMALMQMKLYGLNVSLEFSLLFQFVVLASGLFVLFQTHLAREQIVRQRDKFPGTLSLVKYYRFIYEELEILRNKMDAMCTKLSRKNCFTFESELEASDYGAWVQRKQRDIDHLIVDLEICLNRAKEARATWKNDDEVQHAVRPVEPVTS